MILIKLPTTSNSPSTHVNLHNQTSCQQHVIVLRFNFVLFRVAGPPFGFSLLAISGAKSLGKIWTLKEATSQHSMVLIQKKIKINTQIFFLIFKITISDVVALVPCHFVKFIYLFIYLFIFEKYFFSLIALLWQQSRGLFQGLDFL